MACIAHYTAEEWTDIIETYGRDRDSAPALAEKYGRSVKAIQAVYYAFERMSPTQIEMRRGGRLNSKYFSEAEKADIIASYPLFEHPAKVLGARYNKDPHAVRSAFNHWKTSGSVPLGRKAQAGRFWTDEQITLLIEFWGRLKDSTLARRIGKPVSSCWQKAKAMKLSRKNDFMSMNEVRAIFGMSWGRVHRWVIRGLLPAKQMRHTRSLLEHRPLWRVEAPALEQFMREHPEEYDPRKIDIALHPYWRTLANNIEGGRDIKRVKRGGSGRDWTTGDITYLLNNWPVVTKACHPTDDAVALRKKIALKLGRSIPACKSEFRKARTHYDTASLLAADTAKAS